MSNLNKSDVEKIISYLEAKKSKLEAELEMFISPIASAGTSAANSENIARIRGSLSEINDTLLDKKKIVLM